jgi:hypothetical protein
MIIVTLIVPFGIFPYAIGNGELEVTINALLWVRYPDGSFYIPYYYLLERWSYGICTLWFGVEVVLYTSNRDHRIIALFSGALSLVFPFLIGASFIPWMSDADVLTYVGPIPIQLVIGLLMMRFGGEQKNTNAVDEAGTDKPHS